MVGRDASLAELHRALYAASGGRRQLVFVTGDPGIGKTTLVDQFLKGLRAYGPTNGPAVTIARGQCVDTYGAGEPFMPILDALHQVCDANPQATEILRNFAPTWLLQLPGLLASTDADELRRSLAGSTPERMVRELHRAVETLAAERPLVLVLEDLHWSDDSTIAMVGALARRPEPARLLIVATYRPSDAIARMHPITPLRHDLIAKRAALEVALSGLTSDDVGDYLDARFSGNAFGPQLAEQLQLQTAGNPLFLVNAIDDMELRGWIEVDGDIWRCTIDLARVGRTVPEGTRAMIEARIAQLPEASQRLLEAASVVGVQFASQAAAAAAGLRAEVAEADCTSLARAGQFLLEGDATDWRDGSAGVHFTFRHALYQHVLYDRISKGRVRTIHRAVAARLESGHDGDLGDLAVPLAYHWEMGGGLDRAVIHLLQGARVAQSRLAFTQAIEHLEHALAILAKQPADNARDLCEQEIRGMLIIPVFVRAGSGSKHLELVAERVTALSRRTGSKVGVPQALTALLFCHATRGELALGRARCEATLADCTDFDELAIVANSWLAMFQLLCGEVATGLANAERLEGLPPLPIPLPLDPVFLAISTATSARCLLGRLHQSFEQSLAGCRAAEQSQHGAIIVLMNQQTMRMAMIAGATEIVQTTSDRIADVAERVASERWARIARIGASWVRAHNGDAECAEQLVADWHAQGDYILVFQPVYAAGIVAALLRLGRAKDADRLLAPALEMAETTGEHWCTAELHRLQGEIQLALASEARRPHPQRPTSPRRRTISVRTGYRAGARGALVGAAGGPQPRAIAGRRRKAGGRARYSRARLS